MRRTASAPRSAADVPALENVAGLDKLPVKNFLVAALPMKIQGGSGGPLRIVVRGRPFP